MFDNKCLIEAAIELLRKEGCNVVGTWVMTEKLHKYLRFHGGSEPWVCGAPKR